MTERSPPPLPDPSSRHPDDFEPEFLDEDPGSYLSEWGTRTASVIWGVVNLFLTLGVGQVAQTFKLREGSEWYPLARLVWIFLPVSAVILVIFTVWQHCTPYTKKSPSKAIVALLTAHASLGVWLWYSFHVSIFPPNS